MKKMLVLAGIVIKAEGLQAVWVFEKLLPGLRSIAY
jgi:hypothetical protein